MSISMSRVSHAVVLGAAIILLTLAGRAEAATRTWTGANSVNWSDAGNWGGIAPVAGDDLVFPAGGLHPTMTNDLPAGTTFHSISLAADYTIDGNAIVLDAGGLLRDPTPGFASAIDVSITLSASQTWSVPSLGTNLFVNGDVQLNGQTLTLDVTGGVSQFGAIKGTGAIIKTGSGLVGFDHDNTYAGPTTIENGQLAVNSPNGLGVSDGTLANGTTVNSTSPTIAGTLIVSNTILANEAIVLNGAGLNGRGALQGLAAATVTGPVTLASDIEVSINAFVLTLSGVVSGPGKITIIDNGRLVLANSGNTFSGGVSLHKAPTSSASLEIDADEALPGAPTLDLADHNLLVINGVTQTLHAIAGTGQVNLPTATSVLQLNGIVQTTFGGTFTGSGAVRAVNSSANLTFSGASTTFTGSLDVEDGFVVISGSATPPLATLPAHVSLHNLFASFAVLANASTGSISVGGGTLWLQLHGVSSGQSESLVLDGGSSNVAKVLTADGATNVIGTLHVHGTVTIGNAELFMNLPITFTSVVGTKYTLIDNDGTDPVLGTFVGMPEGARFRANNLGFEISYKGGDGNDIVVTTVQLTRDYLLSEGATSNFFTTDILLANPNAALAKADIDFLKDDGTTLSTQETLPAMSHKLVRVNDLMPGATFSTVVHSENFLRLVVERTMSWDRSGYGAHTEHATEGASTTWYFAEGSQGFFHTYLLLANPQAAANTATVQYLREAEAPLTRTYPLAPTSRLTIDAGADPELVNRSFGMIVTFAQPASAERAMYFGTVPLFDGGHESAGVTAPSTTWFLAEGATGPFFETFLLLANPGDIDATATLTYLPAGGSPIPVTKSVPAHTRVTVNIETESLQLSNAAVSTQVVSTQPILVERSQYWPDPAPNWYEAHNSFGVTALATRWGLAEGRVGNVAGVANAQTYILLANPGLVPVNVTITFLRDNGAAPLTKTFTVQPTTRFNVPVGPGTDVPELSNETFGALITSDQPIAVERAVYWDANGQTWAAGTNATAVQVPVP
jgi:autotransporter-associated beta strand protein